MSLHSTRSFSAHFRISLLSASLLAAAASCATEVGTDDMLELSSEELTSTLTVLKPTSMTTSLGTTSSTSITALGTKDQSGTTTSSSKGQKYTPVSTGYQGVFYFPVPTNIDPATTTAMELSTTFYGAARTTQRWTFQIRDITASTWVTLGYNDGVIAHTWSNIRLTVPAPYTRFFNSSRQVQIRYSASTNVETSQLDYLGVNLTTSTSTTPPPPPPPTTGGATDIRTVFKGSYLNATDRLNYVAKVHDLHVLITGPAKMEAVNGLNPSATMYTYQKIAGLHGPDSIAPTGDPGWSQVLSQDLLWYGPSGAPAVHTSNGWYYIDIITKSKRDAWARILISNIQAMLAQGWEGVMLDNAGIIDPSLITEYPSNYTSAAYYAAVQDLLAQVRAAIPGHKIFINSYTGGAAQGQRGLELLTNCDGISFEAFSMKASSKFFDPTRFQQQLTDFISVVNAGKIAIAMDYALKGDMQRRMWSLAAYLLGNGPTAYHAFGGTDAGGDDDLSQYPEDTLSIGTASAGPTHRTDGLWTRVYSGGTVVANPTTSAITYSMGSGSFQSLALHGGGAYPSTVSITWDALSGTSITVAANSAVIVRAAQ